MNNSMEFFKAVRKIITDYFSCDLSCLDINRIAFSFGDGDLCKGLDESEIKDRYVFWLKNCIVQHFPDAIKVLENENSLKAISEEIYKKGKEIFY